MRVLWMQNSQTNEQKARRTKIHSQRIAKVWCVPVAVVHPLRANFRLFIALPALNRCQITLIRSKTQIKNFLANFRSAKTLQLSFVCTDSDIAKQLIAKSAPGQPNEHPARIPLLVKCEESVSMRKQSQQVSFTILICIEIISVSVMFISCAEQMGFNWNRNNHYFSA